MITGCRSTASAKEIYINALTYMNENIFCYKAEETGYMHEEFAYIKNTEILVDENNLVHSIIENKFGEDGIASQHTVTKYMDFNATKNIDTSSIIEKMEVYKK